MNQLVAVEMGKGGLRERFLAPLPLPKYFVVCYGDQHNYQNLISMLAIILLLHDITFIDMQGVVSQWHIPVKCSDNIIFILQPKCTLCP